MTAGALVAVVAGVAAMSAYEAHIINVTAHIENALTVDTYELDFGTVFPQEYLERNFTVSLSESFQNSGREDYVVYKIVQKPKCVRTTLCPPVGVDPDCSYYMPVDYATHECPDGYVEMENLCEFLSKIPVGEDEWDAGVPSYYHEDDPDYCDLRPREETNAWGVLGSSDLDDDWTVDLKVPPVEGYIGQDWPGTCSQWTVPVDGADYGCDLWLEVTCIGDAQFCQLPIL